MDPLRRLEVTEQLLRSIAGIDEFKGRWAALGNLAPERLSAFWGEIGDNPRAASAKMRWAIRAAPNR